MIPISTKAAKGIGVTIGFTMLVPLFAVLTYFAGPEIEGRFFPVLTDLHVSNQRRIENKLCWDMHFHKVRNATPAFLSFALATDFGSRIPVAVYKADTGQFTTSYGFSNRPAGAKWTSHYCFDIPSKLRGAEEYTVEGQGTYDLWHGLWRITERFPTFYIPPRAELE